MMRNDLLADAILAAAEHPKSARHSHLSAFLGLRGSRFDGELMVVGRAVNGWTEFKPEEIRTVEDALRIAQSLTKEEKRCPLAWIREMAGATVGYNSNRSAFWRTVRLVLTALPPGAGRDEDWASHLAWSNLCKLSGRNGNPQNWLWASQLDACRQILAAEVTEFRPKRILFSTGWDWAVWFVERLAPPNAIVLTGSKLCEAYGRLGSEYGSSSFVVAAHPQGRDESNWAAEVVEGFRKADHM